MSTAILEKPRKVEEMALTARTYDRQPDESADDFRLFLRWCQPDKARDIYTIAGELGPAREADPDAFMATVRRLYAVQKRHRWQARAHAYDLAQTVLTMRAEEAAAKQLAKQWLDRATRLKEEQAAVAEQMIQRAKEMLAFPLTKEKVNTDTGQVELHPSRWTMADVSRLVETANKLLCLATGSATENIAIANAAPPALNLDALTVPELEQLRALMAKASPEGGQVEDGPGPVIGGAEGEKRLLNASSPTPKNFPEKNAPQDAPFVDVESVTVEGCKA